MEVLPDFIREVIYDLIKCAVFLLWFPIVLVLLLKVHELIHNLIMFKMIKRFHNDHLTYDVVGLYRGKSKLFVEFSDHDGTTLCLTITNNFFVIKEELDVKHCINQYKRLKNRGNQILWHDNNPSILMDLTDRTVYYC